MKSSHFEPTGMILRASVQPGITPSTRKGAALPWELSNSVAVDERAAVADGDDVGDLGGRAGALFYDSVLQAAGGGPHARLLGVLGQEGVALLLVEPAGVLDPHVLLDPHLDGVDVEGAAGLDVGQDGLVGQGVADAAGEGVDADVGQVLADVAGDLHAEAVTDLLDVGGEGLAGGGGAGRARGWGCGLGRGLLGQGEGGCTEQQGGGDECVLHCQGSSHVDFGSCDDNRVFGVGRGGNNGSGNGRVQGSGVRHSNGGHRNRYPR